MNENLISKAIDLVGLCKLAKACGVKHQSVYRWLKKGSLPRTDWTGETNYAARIEEATHGQITRAQLLDLNRSAHDPVQQPPRSMREGE